MKLRKDLRVLASAVDPEASMRESQSCSHGTGFGMRGADQAVAHLKICLAYVQISNSRVRVPKPHAPACAAGAGPSGKAMTPLLQASAHPANIPP